MKSLRARWPGEKLYLICDNYSIHKRAEVRAWCSDNEVELVFVPTYSSWLNRSECEFAALRYFALNGTDHRSHGEQDDAISTYIRCATSTPAQSGISRSAPKSASRITYRTLLYAALAAFILTREGLRLR
ncbi:transposase [Nocardia amamiensis]|uniref:transposase n=1 Tax=Nocardia TaxID=1817 RepID=UPI0033F56582